MASVEDLKRQAAAAALEFVRGGMQIGLGSGSTSNHFVELLGERVREGLQVTCVASSQRTADLARECGIELVELSGWLDLAVDGADVIERGSLAAIKGRGGALTREKIVALAARRFVLIADDSKLVTRLEDIGDDMPVPVEVLPFGKDLTRQRLALFGEPVVRTVDGSEYVTDNGNIIFDLYRADLSMPDGLATSLASLPGVVDHGLFIGMAAEAILATQTDVIRLRA